MSSNITVTQCEQGYNWCTEVYLVRGIGRKTVRVILRPANNRGGYHNENQVIINAAKLATRKGWRKIVVATDSCVGDTIRGFNLHQYHHEEWQKGYIGIYLGRVRK